MFDHVPNLSSLSAKFQDKDISVYCGELPHLKTLYFDSRSMTLSGFSSFNTFKIWPLLHTSKIKLKNHGNSSQLINEGITKESTNILGTQLYGNKIYSIHSDNTMREYNIMSGKLMAVRQVSGLNGYIFQQQINELEILLKSTSTIEQDPDDDNYIDYEKEFEVPSLNNQLKFINYKIISFQYDHKKTFVEQKLVNNLKTHLEMNVLLKNESAIDKVSIADVCEFKGPCIMKNNNFGLYVSVDKDLVAFYFRDETNKIKMNYYSLLDGPAGNTKSKVIDYQFSALGVSFSLHAHSFKKYISINKTTNQFQVKAYSAPQYQSVKEQIAELDENEKNEESIAERSKLQKMLDVMLAETMKCNSINFQVQSFFNASPDVTPNFLSENVIIFMNSDNIIMGYDVEKQKEVFNLTQCDFPGACASDINLFSIALNNNILIGKSCLIYERLPDWRGKNKDYERVCPNNFNEFFHQHAFSPKHTEIEDVYEMTYLQHTYKQKIEIMQQSYFGYIFQSKEFLDGYVSEMHIVNTFTFYQHRTLDILESSSQFTVDLLPRDILQSLCYCQLGNGRTFLHKIHKSYTEVMELFDLVQDENDKTKFYVPIFSHASQKDRTKQTTVLDLYFTAHLNAKQAQDEVLMSQKLRKGQIASQHLEEIIEDKNVEHFSILQKKNLIKTAFFLLEQIGTYPFDLFKINLENLIKPIIETDPIAFCYFIDARSKIPDFLSIITEGNVFSNKTVTFTNDGLWQVNEEKLNEIALESKSYIQKFFSLQTIDTVQMKVIDIPYIHVAEFGSKYENNNLLFDKLYETNSIDIYGLGAVKALIEVRWSYMQIRLILIQLFPFVFYLGAFTTYVANDWQAYLSNQDEQQIRQAYICRILVLISVTYSFLIQLSFLLSLGIRRYIQKFWSVLELTGSILIVAGEFQILYLTNKYTNRSEETLTNEENLEIILIDYQVRILYSLASLTLWLKSMYFFRIMRSTGYFIRMFIEVIIDLGTFITILAVIIIAFGLAFLLVERNNNNGGPLIGSFTEALQQAYLLPMGDYSTDYQDYNTWLGWIYFVLATLILNIMMLNLLISVISDTYARIKDQYEMIMYKDLLHLINENKVLYQGRKRSQLNQKYLFYTVPVEVSDQNQPILSKIDALNDTVKRFYNQMMGKEDNQRLLEGIDMKGTNIIDTVAEIGVNQKLMMQKLEDLETKMRR